MSFFNIITMLASTYLIEYQEKANKDITVNQDKVSNDLMQLADHDTMLDDEHLVFNRERNIAVTNLIEAEEPYVSDKGNRLTTLTFTVCNKYKDMFDLQDDFLSIVDQLDKMNEGILTITTYSGLSRQWVARCREAKPIADHKTLRINIAYDFILTHLPAIPPETKP